VSYFEGDLTTLVRLDPPSGLSERFPACSAAFSRQPTLPDNDSREILALGLSEPERIAYIDVLTGMTSASSTRWIITCSDIRIALAAHHSSTPDPQILFGINIARGTCL
jgi:hypothetical protein